MIDGVIYFDLAPTGLEGYNKFIPYYLHPESLYTVSVSTSTFRTKVPVGQTRGHRKAFKAQPWRQSVNVTAEAVTPKWVRSASKSENWRRPGKPRRRSRRS